MNTESTRTRFKIPELTPEEWAAIDSDIAELERREALAAVGIRLSKSGIPEEFKRATELLPAVLDWAKNPTVGLLITGKQGRGKTYQACAALRMLATVKSAAGAVLFATFEDVKHDARDCFAGRDRETDVVMRYVYPWFMVLDDLGKEQTTQWSLPIIFEIIKKRGEREHPTIITTNYTGNELLSRLTVDGDTETAKAIISRLSAYTIVHIDGPDLRRKQ